ncbi:hypothetical protein [Lewinella sp. JB7]|uniref:hypothetical protein n=1 Tax=Lewinella sp. JB7 TaxID=2962887 RepID=UPI0020C99221|nr:hypothetical protein [Lewinella sp. JB7]MCP9237640.1 hypothetical protein [Lewinella sp. JB7]
MENELVLLGRRLLQAYARRDYLAVSRMAIDYLAAAERNRDSAHYGNAIHQANTMLGLIELEHDRVDRATDYLLHSARTPGSPQIKLLGPNMLLADKLLAYGQRSAVLRYLEACRRLWTLSFGTLWRWRWQVARGRTPDFGANLSYLTDYKSFG